MPVKHCCFGSCKSSSRKQGQVTFIPFLKPTFDFARAKRWVHLCDRKESNFNIKKITKFTYICSLHFPDNVDLDWRKNLSLEPIPSRLCDNTVNSSAPTCSTIPNQMYGKRRNHEKSHHYVPLAYPANFTTPTKLKVSPETTPKRARLEFHGIRKIKLPLSPDIKTEDSNVIEPTFQSEHFLEALDSVEKLKEKRKVTQIPLTYKDEACQVDVPESEYVKQLKLKISLLEERLKMENNLYNLILKNEEHGIFYTGMTSKSRGILYKFLGPAKFHLKMIGIKKTSGKMKMPVEQQFILMLVKLRKDFCFYDLALRMGTSRKAASSIFKIWLQFLFHKFNDLRDQLFKATNEIRRPLPKHFQNKILESIRCSIDATEIFCESSQIYRQQGNMYSSYKHHTTIKVLIAVQPSGALAFVSDGLEGSISDREITVRSLFLDSIDKGDKILADRGFTIEDLLMERGASLVLPPFLKKRKHFSLHETQFTKVLSKGRIHVERFNERMKNYKILSGVVPLNMVP